MKILLPNRFKTIGAIIAPLGLAMWVAGQLGYLTPILSSLFEVEWGARESRSWRVGILGTAFFSFLFGLYFIAFSREKLEDEMVQRIRLDSFLFAAFMQIVVVLSFWIICVSMLGDPGQGLLDIFLIGTLLLFWLSYIVRFNYTLHLKYGQWTTQ